jgi:RNA recognition motif-containing protein
MTNKLYVANLPPDTTEDVLRRHFSSCGGVADVEIVTDRQSGRSRGFGSVTMTSPSYAAAALKLNGSELDGNALRVSDAPVRGGAEKVVATVRILQQFRERSNMSYDLDCEGLPLTLRMFPTDEEHWRFEARSTDASDVVVTASGPTRREALTELVRLWNEAAAALSAKPLDGDGLFKAMHDVRAI